MLMFRVIATCVTRVKGNLTRGIYFWISLAKGRPDEVIALVDKVGFHDYSSPYEGDQK